jgi:short-subunit dehydrogenase
MDKGSFAVVTGSGTGIGKAIARELAFRKYNLILHSLPGEGLTDLCRVLENEQKIIVHSFESDLTTEKGPEEFFEFAKSKGCAVSMLVNNAGIGYEGPIEEYSPRDIDKMILLNIRALTHLTHFFMPELKAQKESYILFMSSFGSYLPTAYRSIYLATKTYIYYFARSLESELKGTTVRTCVIVPSAVRTNINTLDRIRRGGWFSQSSALMPEEVAVKGITLMLRGKKVIMPGFLTNLFFAAGMFIPAGIMMMITRNIFRKYK